MSREHFEFLEFRTSPDMSRPGKRKYSGTMYPMVANMATRPQKIHPQICQRWVVYINHPWWFIRCQRNRHRKTGETVLLARMASFGGKIIWDIHFVESVLVFWLAHSPLKDLTQLACHSNWWKPSKFPKSNVFLLVKSLRWLLDSPILLHKNKKSTGCVQKWGIPPN